jgi:RNA polymerase sigma factor FliA
MTPRPGDFPRPSRLAMGAAFPMDASASQPPLVDRDLLIEQHTSYAQALAVKILQTLPPHIEPDELIASGYLGLVEAAEKYDPRRGVSFSTFAYYRIRGAIFDGLRKNDSLPRAVNSQARFASGVNDLLQLASDDDRTATPGALADLDDEIASVQAAIDDLIPVHLLSLEDAQVLEQADPNASFSEEAEKEDLLSFTRSLLNELSEDDRQIIEDIYFKNQSMTEVASRLGITKSWVSRLHARAIRNLRGRMQQHGLLNSS